MFKVELYIFETARSTCSCLIKVLTLVSNLAAKNSRTEFQAFEKEREKIYLSSNRNENRFYHIVFS